MRAVRIATRPHRFSRGVASQIPVPAEPRAGCCPLCHRPRQRFAPTAHTCGSCARRRLVRSPGHRLGPRWLQPERRIGHPTTGPHVVAAGAALARRTHSLVRAHRRWAEPCREERADGDCARPLRRPAAAPRQGARQGRPLAAQLPAEFGRQPRVPVRRRCARRSPAPRRSARLQAHQAERTSRSASCRHTSAQRSRACCRQCPWEPSESGRGRTCGLVV